jgi:hypothetical protein
VKEGEEKRKEGTLESWKKKVRRNTRGSGLQEKTLGKEMNGDRK